MNRGARTRPTRAGDFEALCLENDQIAVTIVPGRGADVLDLFHLARNAQVLWRSPAWGRSPARWSLPEAASFFDHYPGGMQEIFPNGGPSCLYEGAELGFHGDACKVPWDHEVTEDGETAKVVCSTRLARLPFSMRKTFSLGQGDTAVQIDAEITNEGRRELRYMWGFHPAFGEPLLGQRTLLHCPASRMQVHPEVFGVGQQLAPGSTHPWPAAEGADRSVLIAPPAASADLWYLQDLDSGWYVVENPDLDLLVAVSWDAQRMPYLWLWQQCHEDAGSPWFGAQRVVGVEPWTSMPGSGLLSAIEHGSAPSIAPGETHYASLCLGVTSRDGATGAPTGVGPGGAIRFAGE